MQALHKIDHNSSKKLKTQGWKTQNSSKKLKVSAKSKTRFAENRSKKKGWFKTSWSTLFSNFHWQSSANVRMAPTATHFPLTLEFYSSSMASRVCWIFFEFKFSLNMLEHISTNLSKPVFVAFGRTEIWAFLVFGLFHLSLPRKVHQSPWKVFTHRAVT